MINPCDTHPVISSGWCAGNGSADPTKVEGIQLIYAGPHCHAPSCVSMELYLANTGELLCGMRAAFGAGSGAPYDELGYATLPPCLWGRAEDGLLPPPLLPLDAVLLSIKLCLF